MASIRDAIEAICDEIITDKFADQTEQHARTVLVLAQAEATMPVILEEVHEEPIDWQQAAQVLKEFCAAHTAEQCDICPLADWCSDETDLSTLYWKESDR